MNKEILNGIIQRYQTPLYVFDLDEFARRAKWVAETLGETIACCYSIKANPFLLQRIPGTFQKLEVCSPGELAICKSLAIEPERIIFSGVNKTKRDIREALDYGVGICTAESLLHVNLLQEAAAEKGMKVPVLLRLTDGSQFGMDKKVLFEIAKKRDHWSNLDFVGLHYFTGTQKKKPDAILRELAFLEEIAAEIREETGLEIRKIEYGTGLAVDYFSPAERHGSIEQPDAPTAKHGSVEQLGASAERHGSAGHPGTPEQGTAEEERLQAIIPALRDLAEKFDLTVEMGRFFAASCGTYLTRVMDVKTNKGYAYAICDGGSHQLKYYGQGKGMHTPPITVFGAERTETAQRYTLCGSLCTMADVLATAELPALTPGDVLAFGKAGAYSVMEGAALFLSRELPAVILYTEENGAFPVRDEILTAQWNLPKAADERGIG